MPEPQSELSRFGSLCKALAGSAFAAFCVGGIFFDQGATVIAGVIGCAVFCIAMAAFNGAQKNRHGTRLW